MENNGITFSATIKSIRATEGSSPKLILEIPEKNHEATKLLFDNWKPDVYFEVAMIPVKHDQFCPRSELDGLTED